MATTKNKTIGDYWNEIPAPVKIGAYAIGGFMIYNKIKKIIAENKAEQLKTDVTNPVYTLPGGVTTLPGGTPQNLPTFNAAQKAQTFYYFFNPEGWTSDEAGMMKTINEIPADKFKTVAAYYAQAYPGRDMFADANNQLNGSIWQGHWDAYKTQIPLI